MDDRWLSVDEIADYLGVAKDTIYTWVTSKGVVAGRKLTINRGEFRLKFDQGV